MFYIILFLVSKVLVNANEVEIVKNMPYVEVKADGKTYKIQRMQDKDAYLTNTFSLTSRPSPPFFIEPFSVNTEVETFGELEVLDFISKKKGIFVDARLANWYAKSAIATAVNIPFKIFLEESKERDKTLKSLGGERTSDGTWNFDDAEIILLYCNGAWCGQSPTAIRALLELGYPSEKLKYYRGGMQTWQLLGLTTIVPKEIK